MNSVVSIGLKKHKLMTKNYNKVLIVDDVSVHRVALKSQMMMYGFDSDFASNGMEALLLTKSTKYSFVITDLEMPNMNGLELVSNLKKSPSTANIPVIILSLRDEETLIQRCFRLGAFAYIVKPFTSQRINMVLSQLGYNKISGQ
jgi:two-component system chemotaxis response regulator CheY